MIFIKLMNGEGIKARKKIREYFKEQGLEKRLLFYFFISFLPKKLIWFIQENFS